MLPFKTLLQIDATSRQAIFQQLANQLIQLIQDGTLQTGERLPSTRQMGELLNLHRKTIVSIYDELIAQGWLETIIGSGTFVTKTLPIHQNQGFIALESPEKKSKNQPILLHEKPFLSIPALSASSTLLRLDDGFPDVRLAPMEELSRAFRRYLTTGNPYTRLGYTDPKGSPRLRNFLVEYLNNSRGLRVSTENILITRGTMNAVFLASQLLLKQGDNVIVGETNWSGANMNFQNCGANLLTVPIDDFGMVVDAVEEICLKKQIRLLFITSHHHYPTTATLRADRRLKLLQLSEKHNFMILEDDYDYDFHYQSSPHLPLASADRQGMVLYMGSFSKSIAPALRIGYLVAPEEIIERLAQLRRIIDRQGDSMLEYGLSELLEEGIIKRHLRKSLKNYRQRRDIFCEALSTELKDKIDFNIPEGGMAVWAKFSAGINLPKLSESLLKDGLSISTGRSYRFDNQSFNEIRLGFASSTEDELSKSVEVLKRKI
jgi:GntR family transcriptional regulator / MocR family aminotransferase